MAEDLTDFLTRHCPTVGFDKFGVSSAYEFKSIHARNLKEFLDNGFEGEMSWLKETFERRSHPLCLWDKTESIISVAMNYGPKKNPLEHLDDLNKGYISCYAQNKDYHKIFKKSLKRLASKLVKHYGCEVKVFVDTAPVMEKPLAMAAGLGWQGKNTNLVARDYGSWLFLGSIFTDLKIKSNKPSKDHCGACTRCLDICPTKAFIAPYKLDPRACISYLTIEHKGPIDHRFRGAMGNRIYGCDDCLAICPWNKFAVSTPFEEFQPKEGGINSLLSDLIKLNDTEFRNYFTGSPIKRIGRDRFIRNVLIAVGNSKQTDLIEPVIEKCSDVSVLVRGVAIWALSKLSKDALHIVIKDILLYEIEPYVLYEISIALNS